MPDPLLPTWNTHEAKDRLSKLLTEAQRQEQVILRYGKPFAVVMGYDAYMTRTAPAGSAWNVFKSIRLEESLELPQRNEVMREIEF